MRAHRLFTPLLGIGILALAACGDQEPEPPNSGDLEADAGVSAPPTATSRATTNETGAAELRDTAGEMIGTVSLTQAPTGLLLRVEAEGLSQGWHGIHLHAVGDCGDSAFQNAGGHINHEAPVPHGLLNPDGPDDGDLPNIYADASGRVRAELFTPRARIAESGPGQWLWDEDGSAIVIHANPDDHRTQPIGGAGDRVACAVVTRG